MKMAIRSTLKEKSYIGWTKYVKTDLNIHLYRKITENAPYTIQIFNYEIFVIYMQRNYSIDILKFICATLVVFLHTQCAYQDIILPFTRCAVPCFFMISGYLLYKEGGIGRERIMRNFKHVAKITLWATILFIFWKEFTTIKQGGFVPSIRQMIEWVVLNECPFGFHLWYLYAYLYVLLVVYIIDKHKQWKWLFISIPFLLMTDLAFGKYSLVVFGKEFPYILVRNFLCVGLPYFALGAMLKIVKTPYVNGSKIMLWGG